MSAPDAGSPAQSLRSWLDVTLADLSIGKGWKENIEFGFSWGFMRSQIGCQIVGTERFVRSTDTSPFDISSLNGIK
jgi:hypothetical protein